MHNYKINLTDTEAAREATYRLRYELYVEQQGLFRDTADHERRWLHDAEDEHAGIWRAEFEGETVGTARALWGEPGCFDMQLREAFDIDAFTDIVDEAKIAVVSRMLVLPAHRNSLSILIFVSMMETMVERGTELLLGECEPHLINTWVRCGFRAYGLCEHPTNGTLVRIAMVVGDHKHASSIDSPLAPTMKKWKHTGFTAMRLAGRLASSQRVISELKDRAQFWATVEQTLSLEQLAHLLGDLSVDELDALLGNSHALDCDAGSALIRKGHVSRTLYILLTGSLEVWDEGELITEVDDPAAVIGEVAFFSGSERMSDVIAGSKGARVLALSERNLKQLITTQGAGAAKFLLMMTRGLCTKLRQRARPPSGPNAMS